MLSVSLTQKYITISAEFLIEFTALSDWPSQEKPEGKCPERGCARLNDCPNNTYRELAALWL